jgi:predicted PurR-regulated permease PerM
MKNPTSESPKPLFSIQRLAHALIILVILIYFLVVAKVILLPIVFAMLFAFMFKPLVNITERLIPIDFLAIILSFLLVLIPLLGMLFIFSIQVAEVFQGLPKIGDELKRGVDTTLNWLYAKGQETGLMDRSQINNSISELIDGAIGFIQSGLSSTPGILLSIFLTVLYTYFFLYYRKGIKNFFIAQFRVDLQEEVNDTLSKIQRVAQQYLFGLGLVMLIMGTINTAGLYLIGVERPILWGFLAAILTVIPYIGTALGGLLPFLYAAATSGTVWQPVAVLIFYSVIQGVEGNIITPKVVGDSVRVNAMTAILSLIVGGFIWSVPGIILALPLIAIFRIICEEIDWLKPFALLMSNKLHDKEGKFTNAFNNEKFRLSSIFRVPGNIFKTKK